MLIVKKYILCLWTRVMYRLPERCLKGYFLCCRYFKAGGSPELVIQRLSDNYSAVAQTVNLLAEWLIQMGKQIIRFSTCCIRNHPPFTPPIYTRLSQSYIILLSLAAGVEPAQVQERVENHLKSLLIKHFDPQKADSIFTVEGEVRFLKTHTAVQIHDVQKM